MAKYRIMVIDDDEDARRLLSLALAPRYEVIEAHDGLEALSKLETCEPDFAVIDIMMPLMDGYQVCEAIRRHPRFSTIQVMFLSAYGSKENVKRGYAVGANLFLTKPVDPERVRKNIDFSIEHDPPSLKPKKHSYEELLRTHFMPGGPAPAPASGQSRPGAAAGAQHTPPGGYQRPPAFETPHAPAQHTPPPRPAPSQHTPSSHAAPSQQTPPPRAMPSQHTPPPRPAAAQPMPPAGPVLKPRILAVDDDADMLHMIQLSLRDKYEVTTAANGMEAIERMVEYEPDLMLLDIMMPKMNGYQFLQSIRRVAYWKDLPVVVISAKSTPRDREYAARLGATQFLAKPYQIDDLLTTLDDVCAGPDFKVRKKKTSLQEIQEKLARLEVADEDHKRNSFRALETEELRRIASEGARE